MESTEAVVIPDRRLGKLARKIDPRTLRLANYVGALPTEIPKPHRTVSWARRTQTWPMLLNDRIGDCTIVSALHMQQAWCDNIGKDPDLIVRDDQALEAYKRICGYDGTPQSDNGGYELDVLNAWRTDGIAGRKITAFASVDRQRRNLVKLAIDWFGGLYIGAGLPINVQDAKVWEVQETASGKLVGDAEPWSWGGHAMNIVQYNDNYLMMITWAEKLKMTWHWFETYVDEAYCIISDDFMDQVTGQTPRGLNLDQLFIDLKVVTKK
jgi:hypothetical protein